MMQRHSHLHLYPIIIHSIVSLKENLYSPLGCMLQMMVHRGVMLLTKLFLLFMLKCSMWHLFHCSCNSTRHQSHASCHEHRLQTTPQHWICLQIVSICRSLHCLLLAYPWLNTAMHKQTLSGPAKKLGVLFLACSLTETAACELCGSPSKSFQLRTVCLFSLLFQLCTCAESQATGVISTGTLCQNIHICTEWC